LTYDVGDFFHMLQANTKFSCELSCTVNRMARYSRRPNNSLLGRRPLALLDTFLR
jgi:hypothetical protein